MDTGIIKLRCRPIRIAFLIEPKDKALIEAIRINSILWGGMNNPIIPVFSKLPKVWEKNEPWSKYKGKEILKGYLDAFDPDFVVPIGNCAKKDLNIGNRKIISIENIISRFKKDGTPDYGIGIFEVLKDFYNEELKFLRQQPLKIKLFDFNNKNSLFFASIFGDIPSDTKKLIDKNWSEYLGAKKEIVEFSNYADFFNRQFLFIRRILQHKIKIQNFGNSCLFYMDAENNYDIIDYWNLRALGWEIIPIAKQAIGFNSTKKLAKNFIENHSWAHGGIRNYYVHAKILKSRSTEEKEMEAFINSLNIKEDKKAMGSRWSFQNCYPRIWDEWARDNDNAQCCELESGSSETNFSLNEDSVSIKTVDPSFAERFGGEGSPRYANVMSMKIYSNKDIYAEAIPDSGEKLTMVLSGVGLDDWRFSKKESVYLAKHKDWSIYIPIPKAEDVFFAWMEDNGFEVKLSTPGRIAKQMIRQLDGLWGLALLANEELIKLLIDMQDSKITELTSSLKLKKISVEKAEELINTLSGTQVGKFMNKDSFIARISKIANTQKYKRDPIKMLKRYMEHKMFRLGATVQCPICLHNSWYGLDQLKYQLQCANCLDFFDAPIHSPNDISWTYKTFGPFALSGSAEGSYPTLLVLRLFSIVFDFATTPCLSFLTKINEQEREIDLGLLIKESKFKNDEDVRAVFVECKSYNEFQKSDIEKMDSLSQKFPGAVIVFATLRESLTKKEKRFLKPLVNRCRKKWKADEPHNPVLILTKIELFAEHDLHNAWKNASDAHKVMAKVDYYDDKLLYTCDATQQLYLDMKPLHEKIYEKFEKRKNNNERAV